MKKGISNICLMLAVCLAITVPASATIVTVEVTGVVDSVTTDGGLVLDGSIGTGTIMSGFCTYDSQTPDLELGESKGKYALLSISMNIGNYTFTDDPASATPSDYPFFGVYTGDHVYIAYSPLSRFDGTVYLDDTPYSYEDIDWSIRSLELMDLLTSSGEYVPTDALPDLGSWPDLSVFDVRREFEVAFHKSFSFGDGDFVIRGEITSLTVVPEPATIVTFDDITTEPVTMLPIPDNYGGLNWDHIYVVDAIDYDEPSGYRNGLVSGSYVAWGIGEAGDEGDPESFASVITVANPATFDFIGVYLTAGWNDDLNITVEGSRNDALLYSQSVVIDPFGPTWFDFDFINIDHLRFITSGGTPVPGFFSDGPSFVMDNFTFVPDSNAALIGITPDRFEYRYSLGDTNPEPQTLSIWANGIDTLNWHITEDCNWLDVSPTSGQSSGEIDEVNLSVDISGLAPGSYSCELTIFDPAISGCIRYVPVKLFIASKLLVPGQYPTIQAAIDAADDYDVVLVADGTYTGPGNRDIDFLGKAITVRSESGPENCIIDCNGTETQPHIGFYFYNPEDYEDTDCILEGFTITNGYARYDDGGGGAIQCWGSSPTIKNCNIVENQGRGISCEYSSCIITDCIISENVSYGRRSGGGGISIFQGISLINNCTITGNSANEGGGIYCWDTSTTITNCEITGNSARYDGGGIYCHRSSPTITNCKITGNSADDDGGGIYCWECSLTITNCTFSGNSAERGSGLRSYNSNPILTNCILWGDMPEEIYAYSGTPVVTYSDVQGGWPGEGNINDNPCFAFSTDYHLMPNSPCIDAGINTPIGGLPTTDIDGIPRPLDGNADGIAVADMGAYEHNPNSPSIAVSAIAFSFLQDWPKPHPQTLLIRNCGGGTLHWQIVEDCPWLQASPTNGVSTGNINEVTLTVDSNGLALGCYSCVLRVLDPDAANSPLTVQVVLHVGKILRVPDDFFTIQAAIDAANDYDMVLVADGTYTGEGNRDIDFLGKAITVRSESGPENCIIDCNGTETQHHIGFYFHSYEDTDSILEGFTITNGYARYDGGAIQCWQSSPTIKNCSIIENQGRGISCEYSSTTITDCIISENVSSGRGGGGGISIFSGLCLINNCTITGNSTQHYGGGINCDESSLAITNSSISGNKARSGGGIYCRDVSITITDCTITGNSAEEGGGGGILCMHSNSIITNCTISGNLAVDGGGMYNEYSTPTLTNCTFSANSAANGNAFAFDSYKNRYPSSIQVTNCVLWDGGSEIWNNDGSTITITYSDVQGSWPGGGNIDADPCFISPGYWADVNDTNIIVEPNDPNAVWIDGDYYLLAGSPCIDAGDNSVVTVDTDLEGNPRIFDGNDDGNSVVDMGAYEFVPPLEVPMKFTPQALNLRSKGKWVKAHFVLPEGFLPEDVNTNTPVVLEPLGIESDHMNVFINKDGLVEIEAAFSRSDFCHSAISDGTIEVMVVGQFISGQYFYGTDTIKIINKSLESLAIFASHWLDADCRKPHWCAGLDVNQDSVINFIDFAMFDSCCFEVIKK